MKQAAPITRACARNSAGLLSSLALLTACGSASTDSDAHWIELNGAVQKGPFVAKSVVRITPLDHRLQPRGDAHLTRVLNDLGAFSVPINVGAAEVLPVSIEASGFFYHEVSGQLTETALTMRAFAELSRETSQDVFVNLLTHLSYKRTEALVQTGSSYTHAAARAEDELISVLGLGPQNLDLEREANALNIFNANSLPDAYLLLVSAVMSSNEFGQPLAVQDIQERVRRIQTELEKTPTDETPRIDDPELVTELSQAEQSLDANRVTRLINDRLRELQMDDEVANIYLVVDTDGDTIPDRTDNCRYTPNPSQTSNANTTVGAACDFEIRRVVGKCVIVGEKDGHAPGVRCADQSEPIATLWSEPAFELPGIYLDIAVSEHFLCAIQATGQIICAEIHFDGRPPRLEMEEAQEKRVLPEGKLYSPPGVFSQIASAPKTNQNEYCALSVLQKIVCFKFEEDQNAQATDPIVIATPENQTIVELHLGHTTDDFSVVCARYAENGQIACFLTASGAPWSESPPSDLSFSAFDMDIDYGCGLQTPGNAAVCWGNTPEIIPEGALIDIALGQKHICGLKSDGKLNCTQDAGERLGIYAPHDIKFSQIGDGHHHCGLDTRGALHCW